jgi:hypothetical protein
VSGDRFDTELLPEALNDDWWAWLLAVRAERPHRIVDTYARRTGRSRLGTDGRMLLVAADHPARGALGVGHRPAAMADRRSLLARLRVALGRPGVDGVLAAPDVVEDLLLLGALDRRLVVGSMNRGGLAGAVWELDDPVTAYTAESIVTSGLDGGKLLVRIDDDDPRTLRTLEKTAEAVTTLAAADRVALLEPLPYHRDGDGRARLDPDPDRLVRAAAVASALGATSAYTWLKLPATAEAPRVLGATTSPCLLLGGDVGPDPDATYGRWRDALDLPNARGLVAGRALLYPTDCDVVGAVDAAAQLVHGPSSP